MQPLGLRVTALEARVADVEHNFGGQLYKLRRESVATRLDLSKIMQYLGIAEPTDEDVDEVLDGE